MTAFSSPFASVLVSSPRTSPREKLCASDMANEQADRSWPTSSELRELLRTIPLGHHLFGYSDLILTAGQARLNLAREQESAVDLSTRNTEDLDNSGAGLQNYSGTSSNNQRPRPLATTRGRGGAMPRNESRQAGTKRAVVLTPHEKKDAILRVHGGESKASVARDIGVPESTLRGWCKSEQKINTQIENLRSSGNFERMNVTPSSSDNSDNSRPDSSSRSTPTAQSTVTGIGSTTGPSVKLEDLEAGPSVPKRLRSDNSGTAIGMNNMSTSTRASSMASEPLSGLAINPYFCSLLQTDPAKAIAIFNTFMKGDPIYPMAGYTPATTSLLGDTLAHRNNGANMTFANFTANMTIASMLARQQQQSTNVLNGSKRKSAGASGYTDSTFLPRVSSRRQNSQSPNASEAAGSISQLMNNRTSPIPSTSTSNVGAIASIPTKTSKRPSRLNAIICNLQQNGSSTRVCDEISNNNNNNVDHVDNESSNRSPNSLPPNFSEMVTCCTKLVEWLQKYGSPICTFNQIDQIRHILKGMTNWANSKEIDLNESTNGTS